VRRFAFNGFGGDLESTAGPFPFHNAIDLRWLEVFDTLYAGDPRASDVPLFISPGSAASGVQSVAGYRLRPGSPAINPGKLIDPKADRDFVGTTVPACGAVDGGAMEFGQCELLKAHAD
jgi:hypothetical protein